MIEIGWIYYAFGKRIVRQGEIVGWDRSWQEWTGKKIDGDNQENGNSWE